MTSIYLNGKFTAQRTTGVQRVARCLIEALDKLLTTQAGAWILLCPIGAAAPALSRIEVRHVGMPGLPLHVWEQLVLPFSAIGGLLVNLAGAAPYFARRQVCLLHDAAVFDQPEAYTPAFVLWYRSLFRRIAHSAAKVLTVSSFSRGRLAANLGLRPATIGIVPNGADHLASVDADDSVLSRHGLIGSRFLLAVGSANPAKNLARLIQAYGTLPADPPRRLVIVGGNNASVFAAEAADDPSGVVRTGPIDDACMKALYLHATALIFPSLYEGFGLPPLEAMACGCPVAAARAAAIPEVCGDAALYFDPLSVESMADAMLRVSIDESLRTTLRQAGHARAEAASWASSAAVLQTELMAATMSGAST